MDPERMIEWIWQDDQLRADLAYCVPKGIPYSVYMGREVAAGEPQWSDSDRDFVRAYTTAMLDVCHNCGTRTSEWRRDDLAYIGQQHRCPGCQALEQEQRNIPDHATGHTRAYLAPRHLARDDDIEEV